MGVAVAGLVGEESRSASSRSGNAAFDRWSWMAGTYWYVPTECLPAIQMLDIRKQRTRQINDQTLWFIERYESGYLIGRCAASLDGGDFSYMTLVGSVTPEGNVSLSLGPVDPVDVSLRDGATAPALTMGWGHMVQRAGRWAFLMQMSGGNSAASVTHWAYMLQSTPDDESWNNLPGVPGTSIGEVFAD